MNIVFYWRSNLGRFLHCIWKVFCELKIRLNWRWIDHRWLSLLSPVCIEWASCESFSPFSPAFRPSGNISHNQNSAFQSPSFEEIRRSSQSNRMRFCSLLRVSISVSRHKSESKKNVSNEKCWWEPSVDDWCTCRSEDLALFSSQPQIAKTERICFGISSLKIQCKYSRISQEQQIDRTSPEKSAVWREFFFRMLSNKMNLRWTYSVSLRPLCSHRKDRTEHVSCSLESG